MNYRAAIVAADLSTTIRRYPYTSFVAWMVSGFFVWIVLWPLLRRSLFWLWRYAIKRALDRNEEIP
jgi:hypothetical protein